MGRLASGPAYLVALFSLFVAIPRAGAEVGWEETFEGPDATWRDAGGDVRHKIVVRERVPSKPHRGASCEHIELQSAANGSVVYLAHAVAPARIIDELQPAVWIRSPSTGIKVFVRVVLPNTLDPRTHQPVTRLLPGPTYQEAGHWQQLRVTNLPRLLAARSRVLHAELHTEIDTREAYIDRVLLNVYGGEGRMQVWIDDLQIEGFVRGSVDTDDAPSRVRLASMASSEAEAAPRVRLSGVTLLVDGRPFFPRILEYRGESLEFVRDRGFNTIHCAELASDGLLNEALRLGLWVVCPAPALDQLTSADTRRLGAKYASVLAWDLGFGLTARDLDHTRTWAKAIRRADDGWQRPLFADVVSGLRELSRHCDIVGLRRLTIGTSFELSDFVTWLRERARLARPGTPAWATIQTQHVPWPEAITPAGGSDLPINVESDQLQLQALLAVSANMRGIYMQSLSPIDAPGGATRARAAAMELLNLQLGWIEPWIAAGNWTSTIASSAPEVMAAVMETDRARLLVPIWLGPGGQWVPGQSADHGISLVVPGVPETNDAYLLLPGGLRALRRPKKVTGGVLVTLDEFGPSSLVLMTQDAAAVNSLTRGVLRDGPRVAALAREVGASKLTTASRVDGKLTTQAGPLPHGVEWLTMSADALRASEAEWNAGNYQAAHVSALRAGRFVRMLERARWESVTKPLASPVASPWGTRFESLPEHWRLISQVALSGMQSNQLSHGDCESLEPMLAAGWRQFQYAQRGISAATELSTTHVHGGQHSLRLAATSEDALAAASLIEVPPVWVTTPSMEVEAGDLVRIHGWIHVPTPISGSLDGLLIADSLGGETLAERVGETKGWREFTLFRRVFRHASLQVSFALTGLGEAWLDDLSVETLLPLAARRGWSGPTTRAASRRQATPQVRR